MIQKLLVLKKLLEGKPISSNFFVYEMGIARISDRIFNLRNMGYEIVTIRKPEEKKATSYYCISYPHLIDDCKRNGWIIEKD